MTSRRTFLHFMAVSGAAALAQACASPLPGATPPAAAPAAGSSAANAPADWAQVVGSANAEGKVVVNTFPGKGYQNTLELFSSAYPSIAMEHTTLVASQLAPRIVQERQAAIYTWDVLQMPTTTALQVLKPAGVYDPIRPVIVLPEVTDDKVWRDGFAAGFKLTNDQQICYQFTINRAAGVWVNSDQVNLADMKSVKDLLDPKWKGKIVCTDPRISGSTFTPLTSARLKMGDDVMKQFLVDQEPVIMADGTQAAQSVVRGVYPIGIGLQNTVVADFQKQGLGTAIKQVTLTEFDGAGASSSGVVWLVNKAPHPNAAKVYINWLLTRDVQAAWARNTQENSRRNDVEPGDPALIVPVGAELFDGNTEKNIPELARTQELAKQLIK
jgi:iron(III) transport system substrate-binding protein